MSPLTSRQRAKRRRQRLWLYSGLGIFIGVLVLLTWWLGRPPGLDKDQDWTQVDYAALPEVDLLRRYLRIDTTQDHGSELAGAEFLAGELRRMGLDPTVERLGESGANVWAVLEGKRPEALVLHSHIDVYPIADPESWDHDPFSATIEQAWLYGRGVFDMKSVTIVQLLALEALIKQGQQPDRSIIFLATGSEEVGSELGTRWILEQHPDLTSRFWAVLTEGGIVEPLDRKQIKYWGIEFAQKRFATGFFCSDSMEDLEELREVLLVENETRYSATLTEETTRFLREYGPSRHQAGYREALRRPELLEHRPDVVRQLPPYLKATLRNEIAAFPPEPAPGGGFRMRVAFHLLPGQELDAVAPQLLPDWLTHGTTFQLGPPLGADRGSPVENEVFEALAAAVSTIYPETLVGPHFVSWSATDSRFFRDRGILSYGFSPFLIFSTDTFRVDGPNERMSLPGYMSGFEIYKEAVDRIAG